MIVAGSIYEESIAPQSGAAYVFERVQGDADARNLMI